MAFEIPMPHIIAVIPQCRGWHGLHLAVTSEIC